MPNPQERIIPLLVYEDIPAAHDFLVKAFGFDSGGVVTDGDGNAVHGEVNLGGQTIWLHRAVDEFQMAPPKRMALVHGGLVIHVADVEAHFRHASDAGAEVGNEPVDQPYGQREYEARDPEGHRWWFATPIAS
jgi:MerR family transcriptional regulator, thiopeptide resistance regulator